MMCKILLLLAFAQLAFSHGNVKSLDEYYKYLKGLSSAELQTEKVRLEDEVRRQAEKCRPKFSTGVPSRNIPILGPLQLGNNEFLPFDLPDCKFLVFNVFNPQLRGLKDFIISGIDLAVLKNEFDFNITIPKARVEGACEINTTFMNMIRIAAKNGPFFIELQNLNVNITGSIIAKSGLISINDFNIDFNADKMDFHTISMDVHNEYICEALKKSINTWFKKNTSELGKSAVEYAKPFINEFLAKTNFDSLFGAEDFC